MTLIGVRDANFSSPAGDARRRGRALTAARWTLLSLLALGLVLFQTSSADTFAFFRTAPHLLLVVLCCWATIREPEETLFLVPVCGVGVGLLGYQGLTESVAALAPIGLVAIWWSSRRAPVRPLWDWLATLAVVFAATLFHFAVSALAVELSAGGVGWISALRDVLLRELLVNLIIAAPVFWLVRLPTRPRGQDEPALL